MENVLSIHGFTGDENWIKEINELIDMTLENLKEIYGKAMLRVFF